MTGVIHVDEKHEAVQLRLRQRVGPFLLNGVLGGQHKERRGQREETPRHRHPMLLHRLQQRRLRLGRRAVDFIGQNDVGKKRPFDEHEGAAARLIGFLQNIRAGDVRGHQIRRELDAVEAQRHGLGQGIDDGGLGQAGHAHQQPVAAGQDANQQPLNHDVLSDNDLGQFGAELFVIGPQIINGRNVIPRQGGGWHRGGSGTGLIGRRYITHYEQD